MTPENVVERLLAPTARFFEPRKILPLPSTEPAVVPLVVRFSMSRIPVPFKINRAVPPLAPCVMEVIPPLSVVMVALPAVLPPPKVISLLLVMLALPAALLSLKNMLRLLTMVALLAGPLSLKARSALLVMVAVLAVLVLLKLSTPLLVMLALPAVLVLENEMLPVLVMLALPPLITMPAPVICRTKELVKL